MSIEELLKDEGFVRDLEAAEKDANVIALFQAKGIAITEADIKALRKECCEGELSEDNLEEVAGGMLIPIPVRPINPRNPVVTWIIKRLLRR